MAAIRVGDDEICAIPNEIANLASRLIACEEDGLVVWHQVLSGQFRDRVSVTAYKD